MQVLRQLPTYRNSNVLVNSSTFDDAGVYRLDRHRALVQTVDFFTPIVDDPFSYGQIAAANALSDVFAMGGRPLTALNIMGFPTNLVPPKTIIEILRGGLEKAAEVGCAIIGGHSIRNPEPIYGLAVTGIVDLRYLMTNANARPGDVLVLTKPVGTGIATTAIKHGLASRALEKKVVSLMSKINSIGAELAERHLVRAATDITGFGFIGHLTNMCRRACVPAGSRDNLAAANSEVDWGNVSDQRKILLTDAQTSGGLLLCVAQRLLPKVLRVLRKARAPAAAIVGQIVRRRRGPIICMTK